MSLTDTIAAAARGSASLRARANDEREPEGEEEDPAAEEEEEAAETDDEDAEEEEPAAEGDDEEAEEDEEAPEARARACERKRIKAILSAPQAAANASLAAHLAFSSGMSSKAALAALKASASASGSMLPRAMRGANPRLGAGGAAPSRDAPAARLAGAIDKIVGASKR